ncbi:MAG: glycerol-3-phosphate dehydrogenase/oxidase [Cardiobacteriaceae bacterium]|nr:glycerol-3-phosphate dehydrogenase/oxidase [Cardiobacteriaceae bacterium]
MKAITQRSEQLNLLNASKTWDVIIIGGGASGLGAALDAVTRGFSTLLLEAHDFAKGTSSRSTKLVHGGVRYLAQGDVALVREALRERGRLAKNASHLFKTQPFIIPGEKWWTASYYTFGLWFYDRLSGKLSIGKTRHLSQEEAKKRLVGVKDEKLRAGVCYYDGQFDDARLALTLAQTAMDKGATVLNYCKVIGLEKNESGKICGVKVRDEMSGVEYVVQGKAVVNATGVFANDIMRLDDPNDHARIVPSQGVHLVLDSEFLPGTDALMVPKTSDSRVLFAVPWHGKLVVGTTDTLIKDLHYEPKPLEQEIQFILDTAKDYLKKAPTRADVKSVFVGLRPLAAPKEAGKSTKEVSRSHKIEVSDSGLIHVLGGKWTTYRQMAEDTIDAAIHAGLLPQSACQTVDLALHGSISGMHLDDNHLAVYGSDAEKIKALCVENAKLATAIHPNYPYTFAQVLWAMEHESALTLEDVLARRIRLLFLDARAAGEAAESVAHFMAEQLQWDDARQMHEIESFKALVSQYSL